MTTVGFIGSGNIGTTVARLAVEVGHQVVLSNSRGPDTLADTAAQLGHDRGRGPTGQMINLGLTQSARGDHPR
jgi:predicted dinucleotide-binding enzyme